MKIIQILMMLICFLTTHVVVSASGMGPADVASAALGVADNAMETMQDALTAVECQESLTADQETVTDDVGPDNAREGECESGNATNNHEKAQVGLEAASTLPLALSDAGGGDNRTGAIPEGYQDSAAAIAAEAAQVAAAAADEAAGIDSDPPGDE